MADEATVSRAGAIINVLLCAVWSSIAIIGGITAILGWHHNFYIVNLAAYMGLAFGLSSVASKIFTGTGEDNG